MNEKALSRALARPPVAAHLESLKAQEALEADSLKKHARTIAIRAGMELMRNAQSEAVKARMVELFASEPKSGAAVQINQHFAPGGYEYPAELTRAPATDGVSLALPAQPIEDAEVIEPGCDEGVTQPPD